MNPAPPARRPVVAIAAPDASSSFPRAWRAAIPGVDLAHWLGEHREALAAELVAHGALLFRGFSPLDASAFEAASRVLLGPLDRTYPELGGLAGDAAYLPTPYPPDEAIPFHNEGAHRPTWPRNQAFACLAPARSGGATPLADGRRVLSHLPRALADRLAETGVIYRRRFVAGLDIPWPAFFETDSRERAEDTCRAAGDTLTWDATDAPRLASPRPAFVTHPATGEALPFHQILTHHPATLPARLRSHLHAAGESPLRQVSFGDGAPIDDGSLALIADAYARSATSFAWAAGDVLFIDNLRVAHARAPFEPPRRVLVALA
jgi:alpha-ketoglutarate-dependent taurine dioxygenase